MDDKEFKYLLQAMQKDEITAQNFIPTPDQFKNMTNDQLHEYRVEEMNLMVANRAKHGADLEWNRRFSEEPIKIARKANRLSLIAIIVAVISSLLWIGNLIVTLRVSD